MTEKYVTNMVYNSFVSHIPKNFPRVSFASNVKNSKGINTHLKVIQDGVEYRFEYTDTFKPFDDIKDLKILEDELFLKLKD